MNSHPDSKSGFIKLSTLADVLGVAAVFTPMFPNIRRLMESNFWVAWILVAAFVVLVRLGFRFNWIKFSIDDHIQKDLNTLFHRLELFQLDSKWISQLKDIVRDDKLPETFYEGLLLFKTSLEHDQLVVRNRKLRNAFESLLQSVNSYISIIDSEFDSEGLWVVIPEATRRNRPDEVADIRQLAGKTRIELIENYSRLINLIYAYGGEVRRDDSFRLY